MTEHNLAIINLPAKAVYRAIKRVASSFDYYEEASLNNTEQPPANKSVIALIDSLNTPKSKKSFLNYEFKTDPKHSPTRRLIEVKNIHEASPPMKKSETEVILYSSNPNIAA